MASDASGAFGNEPALAPTGQLSGHKDSVTTLCVSDVGEGAASQRLVSGSEDGTARLWDLERHKTFHCFVAPKGLDNPEVASVAAGEGDLQHLVAVARGSTVSIYDSREPALVNRAPAWQQSLHLDDISELRMDGASGWLAAGDDAGEALVYDVRARKLLRRVSGCHSNICASVCFRPGHKWELISGGLDARVVHTNFNKTRTLHAFSTATSRAPRAAAPSQLVNPRFAYAVDCDPSGTPLPPSPSY